MELSNSVRLFGGVDEFDALLGLSNQIRDHLIQSFLFGSGQSSEGKHLLDSVRSQTDRRGKEGRLGQGVLHEGALDHVLLASDGGQQSTSKHLTSVSLLDNKAQSQMWAKLSEQIPPWRGWRIRRRPWP
jgi:hypothetical protein